MKRFIKSIVSAICLGCMLISLAACTDNNKESETETEYYTVSFNTHGGTPVDSIKVKPNHHATEPESPTLENYVFHRWLYKDEPWFFDIKKVTSNMTLDASWIKAEDFFAIAPHGEGLGISDIKQQKDFHKLLVPTHVNNLPIVAVLDGGCSELTDSYAHTMVFPESMTYIGIDGFKKTVGVQLEFEGAVTFIGESAFEECTSITNITLGKGMSAIPLRAFAGATALKTLDIPEGVTAIQENAFEGCTSMLTVVFPTTLETVEDGAFEDAAIKTVFYAGTEEQFDEIEILRGNDCIIDAKLCFYSETEPTEKGNFWHYGKNNTPIIW